MPRMKQRPESRRTSRRRFIGATVASLGTPALASPSTAGIDPTLPPPQLAAPSGIDVPTLRLAQTVAAVQLSDEALLKALPLVTRYRSHIERLRTVPLPAAVEPAFSFNPRRLTSKPSLTPRASPVSAPRIAPARMPPPASELDIAYATLAELRAWLRAGQVSSEQLTQLSLSRLKLHDPTLSCVVTLSDERALAEAKRADAESRGKAEEAELRGIPYGAKDIFDSAGLRTQWGARPYLDRATPTRDATAIARLAATGACLTAKLSTGELAIGDTWSGDARFEDGRPLSGTAREAHRNQTRNPWDPGTGASGSSAGPAATRPIFAAAIEVYRKAGFEVVPVTLPPFPASALYAIHNAEAGAMFDEITRSGAIDDLEGQGQNDRSTQLRASRFIPAVDYIRAQRVRTLMIAALEDLFERIDVFLAPPSSESVNITNLTGHPALVLPAGFLRSATGIEMPQNIMLTGRLDDEATLLDAGLAFERETPWHTRRPPLYS